MDNQSQNLIMKNNGLLFFCFSATWCVPCQRIKETLHHWVQLHGKRADVTFIFCDIDQDDQLYAYYRKKRLLSGIPAIIVFDRQNKTSIFTDIVNSSKIDEVNMFFTRWLHV